MLFVTFNFMHFLYSAVLNSKSGLIPFNIEDEVNLLRKNYGEFDKVSVFDCFLDFLETWIDLVKEDQRGNFFWAFLASTMDFSKAYPPYIHLASTAKSLFSINENADSILQGFIDNKYNKDNLNNLLSLSPEMIAVMNQNKRILARQNLGQKLFNFSRISVSTSPSHKFRLQTIVESWNSVTDEYGFDKSKVSGIINCVSTLSDDNKLYADLKWAPVANFDSVVELILCENEEMSVISKVSRGGGSTVYCNISPPSKINLYRPKCGDEGHHVDFVNEFSDCKHTTPHIDASVKFSQLEREIGNLSKKDREDSDEFLSSTFYTKIKFLFF